MEEVVYARFYNPELNIALKDWREVYLLTSAPQQLLPEVHRGKLVYRARGSGKRISYERIKKGLVKKACTIWLRLPF